MSRDDANLNNLSELVNEIRAEHNGPLLERIDKLEKQVAKYERTFGLAVIPTLLRRAFGRGRQQR